MVFFLILSSEVLIPTLLDCSTLFYVSFDVTKKKAGL